MFDTVEVGTRTGQVKCFGRGLQTLRVGDSVTLFQQLDHATKMRLLEAADPDDVATALELSYGDPTDWRDYQVVMQTEAGLTSYLIVRDAKIHAWSDEAHADLPRVDNSGRRVRPGVETVG
jgi:hypothetical protein